MGVQAQTLISCTASSIPIRLLVADDSDLLRGVINRFLSEEPRVQVVGEAKDFTETVQKAGELKPTVVLMDVHMRDESRFPPDLVRSKLLASTECVLAMSFWNDDETVSLSSSYGASMLLAKSDLGTELLPAIEKLCT